MLITFAQVLAKAEITLLKAKHLIGAVLIKWDLLEKQSII